MALEKEEPVAQKPVELTDDSSKPSFPLSYQKIKPSKTFLGYLGAFVLAIALVVCGWVARGQFEGLSPWLGSRQQPAAEIQAESDSQEPVTEKEVLTLLGNVRWLEKELDTSKQELDKELLKAKNSYQALINNDYSPDHNLCKIQKERAEILEAKVKPLREDLAKLNNSESYLQLLLSRVRAEEFVRRSPEIDQMILQATATVEFYQGLLEGKSPDVVLWEKP